MLDVQKEVTDVAQNDEEQVAVTVEQAPYETPNDAETKVSAETERLARKEAELIAREEALKQREEAAQKAGGQRQSYGVPPISPRQIAQQERAEEKKKMVKFALLSLAVFAVIVGAFTPFYSSEDKPQKPTESEEVSNEPDSRDNNKTPQDDSWPGRSSKGAVVGAAQSQVTKNDTTAKTTTEVTMSKSPSSLQTGNGNNGGNPNKNAKDKPEETLGNKNNPVSTAGENEKPETPSAPGTTALKDV